MQQSQSAAARMHPEREWNHDLQNFLDNFIFFFAATFGTKVTLKRQRRLWAPGREAIWKKMGIVRKNRKSETRPRGDLEER